MRTSALLFMIAAWAFVLGLTLWSFRKLMIHAAGARATAAAGEHPVSLA